MAGRHNLLNACAVAVLPFIYLHQCQGGGPPLDLSSRPERTRISCFAALSNGGVCGFQ
jgi:hypothetical protein